MINKCITNDLYYEVLPTVNFGFNVDFTGQILKLICKNVFDIPDYYCLEQPEIDNNGKNCNGVVCISKHKLKKIQ